MLQRYTTLLPHKLVYHLTKHSVAGHLYEEASTASFRFGIKPTGQYVFCTPINSLRIKQQQQFFNKCLKKFK